MDCIITNSYSYLTISQAPIDEELSEEISEQLNIDEGEEYDGDAEEEKEDKDKEVNQQQYFPG